MFAKEEEKFGKKYTFDRLPEGNVENLTDLELGDLFIFAGGREILKLGETGDDMCGSFFTATRILTDEIIWTSYDYSEDVSNIVGPGRETGHKLSEDSPRIVRIKEMHTCSSVG